MRAALSVYVEGTRVDTLTAPADFGVRAWILGVVGVKMFADGERVRVVLNLGVTGAADRELQIDQRSLVQITVGDVARPQGPGAEAGAIVVALDGERIASARPNGGVERGFGHVFCRWMRDEPDELGFDLTRFQTPAAGVKYERLVSRPLVAGQVVSYRLAL